MNNKKKTKVLLISFFIVSVIALTTVILILRSDWRFVVVECISQVENGVDLEEITENSINLVDYSKSGFCKDKRVIYDQSMMLINSDNLIKDTFLPEVVNYNNTDVIMNSCVTDAYADLSEYVYSQFGQKLFIMSSFRTKEEQEKAIEENNDSAADVGASEHQAGLALDVYVSQYAGNSFLKTDVGQYVNSECWEYGFIIRYPYYGVSKTGIKFEPWHIRYLGFPHAEIIYKNSLTLEEYIKKIEFNKYYKFKNYIITKQRGETLRLPESFTSAVISEDNQGNFIISVKVQ